jgi:hypothetical protein
MLPSAVSGLSPVARALSSEAADTGTPGACSLANPKSSSFAPDFVSITLPGLRSRWTIPRRWATSSAPAISTP